MLAQDCFVDIIPLGYNYDNQTELLLQTKLQLQIKKKKVSGQQRKAVSLKLTLSF